MRPFPPGDNQTDFILCSLSLLRTESMPSVLQCHQPAKADHAQLYEILVSELTDFVVFLMDPTGCIVSWNPGVERILGYTEAEWLGQSTERIFTPEDRAHGKPQEEMTKAARDGRAPDIRWHLRKNGERLYVEGTMVALRNEAGQLLGFSKVMRDITERRRKEERNAFLVRLDDALRPLTDPNEITRTASRLLCEHLQLDRCVYCTFLSDEETFDLMSVSIRPEVPSMADRYTPTQFGKAATELFRSNRPIVVDDTENDPSTAGAEAMYRQLSIRAHASVPFHKGGRLLAAMGFHQFTPRKWRPDEFELVQLVANRCWESLERMRVEAALRQSEAQLRALVTASSDVLYRMSPDWTEMHQLDGRSFLSETESSSTTWLQKYIQPDDQPHVLAAIREAVRTKGIFELEHRVLRVDGTPGWTLSRAVPLLDTQGEITEWFGAASDVTERKRAEEELRLSHRELEEFAYIASHDLQEPLRMVNIYTQLILKYVKDQDTALDEYAEFVRQGVTRMQVLIRDLLTYSRTVHREPLPVGTADLSVSLGEAVSVLQNRIEESGATITASPLPAVRGDTKQMAQVFQNLLSNALKYRQPDIAPNIEILAERDGAQWIISVRDNGIGFDPQYAERIFGLFKRLHTDEYPGTGLGLAICQRVIERYGGRLWAEGRPGQGATFFFALPPAGES